MLKIEESSQQYRNALFHLGFRPFFIAASLFAIVSMLLWLFSTSFGMLPLANSRLTPVAWHGHELVYGYSMAVIAGFLLTAVRNWTNVQTVHGPALAVLAALWILARVMPFVPGSYNLWLMAIFDTAFMLGALLGVLYPILKVRQFKQLSVASILLILIIGNGLFYYFILSDVAQWNFANHLGLYCVLVLIMLMARRVIPFFIEKGVDYPVRIKNILWLDVAIMTCVVLFAVSRLGLIHIDVSSWLAWVLLVLNTVRLWQWHTAGIWCKPLLWSLYLAYAMIVIGFGLSAFPMLSSTFAIHALAVGGIGLMTISMMSRIALGHTGRNVFEPPRILIPVFVLLLLACFARVFMPMFNVEFFNVWILIAQFCWVTAFSLFAWVCIPMLYKPRVDGRYG